MLEGHELVAGAPADSPRKGDLEHQLAIKWTELLGRIGQTPIRDLLLDVLTLEQTRTIWALQALPPAAPQYAHLITQMAAEQRAIQRIMSALTRPAASGRSLAEQAST